MDTADNPLQYLGIVYSLAQRHQWDADSFHDLVGVGNIALFDFFPRFDPRKRVRMSTYLYSRIAGRMRNWIRDYGGSRRARRGAWERGEGRGSTRISIQQLENLVARRGRGPADGQTARLLCDEIRSLILEAGLTPEEAAALAQAVASRAEGGQGAPSTRLEAAQRKMLRARQRAT